MSAQIQKTIKKEISLPEEFQKFFEYLKLNFGINDKEYLQGLIINEVNSRNRDLNIF